MPIISNFPSGSGGGGGIALAPAVFENVIPVHEKIYIKWTDPEDLVVADSTLAEWNGTLLVRKAGSPPTSRRDGVIVLDSKTRNAYKESYFCDSGLTNGVEYYYRLFPYTTAGTYTKPDDNDYYCEIPQAVLPGSTTQRAAEGSGNGKVTIYWSDPAEYKTSDGIITCKWASTKVVYKEDGYPTGPDDGTLVINSTTHNAYNITTDGLQITGLENGKTYYFAFFPISTDGAVRISSVNRITAVPNRIEIAWPSEQITIPTYDGGSHFFDSSDWGCDVNKVSCTSESLSYNDAGTYQVLLTPRDDYMWEDGTTDAYETTFTISKAVGVLTLSANSVSLTPSNLQENITAQITAITNGYSIDIDPTGWVITATSSDTNVVRASVALINVINIANVNQTSGTATITVSVAEGTNYTAPESQTITVTAEFAKIYGVLWDGTSTTKWSRTDGSAQFVDPVSAVNNGNGSSPFDNLMPWSGMTRVTDSEAGELVAIPKFWYKWTKSGNTLKLQIADGEVDGFHVSPAHADRGDGKGERDIVYVGRYHCSMGCKSATGINPLYGGARSAYRSAIHKLGSTIWQFDYAMLVTIQMLYLVEFADWNSQAKIGYGCGNGSSIVKVGQTDAMPYHTGTSVANRTAYGSTQYRNIEGLWDNVLDWIDGCYYNTNGMNIILNPNNFSDSTNGTLIGKPSTMNNGGYPSSIAVSTANGFEWVFYPTAYNGSNSTYISDYWGYYPSYPLLCHGGSYGITPSCGLFNVGCEDGVSNEIGCRLQKLP